MKPAQHPTALRIRELLQNSGVEANVVEFEQTTRTSADAAAAIGCTVAEIAKSVVFRGKDSGQATGYVIGGVAPIGHAQQVKLLLDQDLRQFAKVWAAGGTPFTVFPITPDELRRITGTDWEDVKQ